MRKRAAFESLGHDVRGGRRRPPYAKPPTIRDVAFAIHAALVEVGLPPHALRKVGCVLLSLNRRALSAVATHDTHAKAD